MLAAVTVKRQRPKLKTGGRFDPHKTADELEGLRGLAKVEPKDVGSVLWPGQSPENAARTWYKRRRQGFSNLAEISAAVDYLLDAASRKGLIEGKVLPGFPFIDLFISLAIERGEMSWGPVRPKGK